MTQSLTHLSLLLFPFHPKTQTFHFISSKEMAMSGLLSPTTPLTVTLPHSKPLLRLHSPFLFSLNHHHSILTKRTNKIKPRRPLTTTQSKGTDDSVDAPDRLISAVCYFYPFFDGIQYGKYVITQFTAVQTLIQPLIPAIRVFKSFPFNGFLVFLTLYFGVVRNSNFSRYVRFNTMQVIVLDVLLIFPDLLERSFNPKDGLGLDVLMSMDSTVFLFLLVCLVYGSASCVLGQVPRLPIVAEAAERQVP
ncbi:protein TIC 20-v, chloroplastic [Pyrus x bretschneideri]|uniref:protein TIC 20-v, chloroplastic n=1 Tax=Pyrus x bretschneideri TaxID=225117 RepID=UPI00202E933E|nr:protein TIC 20-v, chloroplastic [Pyrus x bretschneideri]